MEFTVFEKSITKIRRILSKIVKRMTKNEVVLKLFNKYFLITYSFIRNSGYKGPRFITDINAPKAEHTPDRKKLSNVIIS